MTWKILTACLAVFATGAGAATVEQTVEGAMTVQSDIRRVGEDLLRHQIFCGDPRITQADAALEAQRTMLLTQVIVSENRSAPDFVRALAVEKFKRASPVIASSQLQLADALLQARCFDAADNEYRQVLKFFTGSDFEGQQRRAKVGIEDVRATRVQ